MALGYDQPLCYLDGSLAREEAAKRIAGRYREAIDVYESAAG